MTFRKKYNSLSKQCISLFICVFSCLLPLAAQTDCGNETLVFSSQPRHTEPKTICTNYPDDPSSVEFAVALPAETGYRYEYIWQKESVSTPVTWENMPSETRDKYSTSVPGKYRCYVRKIQESSGICAGFAYSDNSTLTVLTIKSQPDPSEIKRRCETDGAITFKIEMEPATGNGYYYRYTWQRKSSAGDWNNIGPAQGDGSYQATSEGEYRCYIERIEQIGGTPTRWSGYSAHGVLVVDKAPGFAATGVTIPQVCDGSDLTASITEEVSPNGRKLENYEWKFSDNSPFPPGSENINGQVPANNKIPDLIIHGVNISEINNKRLTVTVTNECGSTSAIPITVVIRPTPNKPTPANKTYCYENGGTILTVRDTMFIVEPNRATWFDIAGQKLTAPPVPDVEKIGNQKWAVSQKVRYVNGPTCESDTVHAFAKVLELSAYPEISNPNVDICRNTRDVNVEANGSGIRWYSAQNSLISVMSQMQINTSNTGLQTYFVTQTETGKCESIKDGGKVNVLVREVSSIEEIDSIWYNRNSCPAKTSIIEVKPHNVREPVYKWYTAPDKSGGSFYEGQIYETPVLMNDVAYYVSIQYKDSKGEELCESVNTKAAVIYVRDIELPQITAPPSMIVYTDDGECHSTVKLEKPIVSDNCTDEDNIIVFIGHDATPEYLWDAPEEPKIFALGDTTLLWWALDEAGLKDYDYQSITVRDREKPKGQCPATDIIWEIDENETSAIVRYDLHYTDNCGVVIDSLNMGLASGSVFKLGKTRVRHFMYDPSGNVDTCDFNVVVQHPYIPLLASLKVSNYELCPGEELVITPIVSGGTGRITYLWNRRNWTEAVMRDYPLAKTTYQVTITDGKDTFVEAVDINVLPRQDVSLSLFGVSEEHILEGDEVIVNATPNFQSYKLILNDKVVQLAGMNSIISFEAELGEYRVQVFATDANGCVAQDYMKIDVESKILPNIFTPNMDGKNEVFLKGFLREGDLLEIFNRAGVRLYSGCDGWDGYYRGALMPQATYLYTLRRRMNTGEIRIYKGTVTLKL